MFQLIYFLVNSLLVFAINPNAQTLPFNISKPKIKIKLSKELKEISALTWIEPNQIGAVQDEAGVFYILNAQTGKIEEKNKFSLPGDFEGIEMVGECIYAITSNGTIFYFDKSSPDQVKRINTPLGSKNDVEGLGYDASSGNLIIVCKENGSVNNAKFKGKSIFTLSVENHFFSTNPLVTIKKSDLDKFIKVDKFKPSGLAVDPLTQNIYIIASAGNMLVVLDKNFRVKTAVKLPSKIYAQPEGICFSPKGDLYISNEGKDHKANFYHLKRLR